MESEDPIEVLHLEVSKLASFIALPQLISAPLSVYLYHWAQSKMYPALEFAEVLEFLVISFPLTLAIAIITVMIKNQKDNFWHYLLVVLGAAVLSNLLHALVSSMFPAVNLQEAVEHTFDSSNGGYHGPSIIFIFILNILGLYWKKFGFLIFIQSCAIGVYAGIKYFK